MRKILFFFLVAVIYEVKVSFEMMISLPVDLSRSVSANGEENENQNLALKGFERLS